MRNKVTFVGFASLVLACASLGCGRADVGDSCSKEGDLDECVDEALCAKDAKGELQCQLLCAVQADCPAGTNCNGTSGTLKVCQPK
ncbi:MAG: hypothetical protein HY908_18330 [Myxococcales bacterium]|nr:hypothetical protein [Myxococcales bacterium]